VDAHDPPATGCANPFVDTSRSAKQDLASAKSTDDELELNAMETESEPEDDDGSNFKRTTARSDERRHHKDAPASTVTSSRQQKRKGGRSKSRKQEKQEFDSNTGLYYSAMQPPAKKTAKSPPREKKSTRKPATSKTSSNFPIQQSRLLEHGFIKLREEPGSYQGYLDMISYQRRVAQRGFLVGNALDYPAIIQTASHLQADTYIVTDKDGFIVCDMVCTVHASAPQSEAERYSQRAFNPAKFNLVADMASLESRPFQYTHHLALSSLPRPGEYRATRRNTVFNRYETTKVWLDNARTRTNTKPREPKKK
jgi:hypothetical protein